MTKPVSLKSDENEERSSQRVYNHWECALWAILCVQDPDRRRWRKTDINWAKNHAQTIASSVASKGPKWLDETSAVPVDPVDVIDEIPEFASELGSISEWRIAHWSISELSSTMIELISSTEKDDALLPDMFETLGILAYVQARIAQVLERTEMTVAGPG